MLMRVEHEDKPYDVSDLTRIMITATGEPFITLEQLSKLCVYKRIHIEDSLLSQMFNEADTHKAGRLDGSDLFRAASNRFAHRKHTYDWDQLLRKLSFDPTLHSSLTMSREKFKDSLKSQPQLMEYHEYDEVAKEAIVESFVMIDRDGDDWISLEDLLIARRKHALQIDEAEIAEMFAEADFEKAGKLSSRNYVLALSLRFKYRKYTQSWINYVRQILRTDNIFAKREDMRKRSPSPSQLMSYHELAEKSSFPPAMKSTKRSMLRTLPLREPGLFTLSSLRSTNSSISPPERGASQTNASFFSTLSVDEKKEARKAEEAKISFANPSTLSYAAGYIQGRHINDLMNKGRSDGDDIAFTANHFESDLPPSRFEEGAEEKLTGFHSPAVTIGNYAPNTLSCPKITFETQARFSQAVHMEEFLARSAKMSQREGARSAPVSLSPLKGQRRSATQDNEMKASGFHSSRHSLGPRIHMATTASSASTRSPPRQTLECINPDKIHRASRLMTTLHDSEQRTGIATNASHFVSSFNPETSQDLHIRIVRENIGVHGAYQDPSTFKYREVG
eukprot:TRINITY_DN3438_c0_g1_i14.p1 TRINITY_DN3438_c0_g1~~TRINITY_DN3438_c0_g1_i14.p1  ORF type:complete len:563 (+),score=103.38 TRINITY_DN3438_c0_g1_i14:180-1868(+)